MLSNLSQQWLASVIWAMNVDLSWAIYGISQDPDFNSGFAEAQGLSVASHQSFVTGCRENSVEPITSTRGLVPLAFALT